MRHRRPRRGSAGQEARDETSPTRPGREKEPGVALCDQAKPWYHILVALHRIGLRHQSADKRRTHDGHLADVWRTNGSQMSAGPPADAGLNSL